MADEKEKLSREEIVAELVREIEIEDELLRRYEWDLLSVFTPNPTQWDAMNSTAHETLLSGPNQVGGKTYTARALAAIHLTGLYPDGWEGPRFDEPFECALAGVTAQSTRDHLIEPLIGPKHARGSGWLPAESFDPDKDLQWMGGAVKDVLDKAYITHHGPDGKPNGKTVLHAFSYEKGWRRVQGYPLKLIILDEFPKDDVYSELRARINYTLGYIYVFACPLEGETESYLLFEEDDSGLLRLINYTIDDCIHLTKEQYDFTYNRWKNHPEAEARLYGRPCRGTGIVYGFRQDKITVPDFDIPSHWPRVIGLDWPHGVGHFAAVSVAIDPNSDIAYVVSEYKEQHQEAIQYASRVKLMGGDRIPCAWPHDMKREFVSGGTAADKYRDLGLNMMRQSAHLIDNEHRKTFAIMSVIEECIDRFQSGRLKIFHTCGQLLREIRLYRHDKGKPEKNQDDHLIDALHKAIMMLRNAEAPGVPRKRFRRLPDYEFFS